ncbi:MAG: hypothetical protein ACYS8L_05435 [Planctomycetota bacterium]|jgi:uncharacterized membrane-anchored protein YhcB (DUF1043 family)
MSEETRNEASLDAVQAQVNELSSQLRAANAAAGRRWKLTAWVFAIVCAVIAIYLGVIYAKFKPFARPELLVRSGISTVTTELPRYKADLARVLKEQAPELVGALDAETLRTEIPKLTEGLAAQIRQKAPGVVEEQIEAQADRLRAKLPEVREDLARRLKAAIPDMMDGLMPGPEEVKARLPELRQDIAESVTRAIPGMLDSLMPAAEDVEARIPEVMDSLRERVKESIPGMVDSIMPATEEVAEKLPELREQLAKSIKDAIRRPRARHGRVEGTHAGAQAGIGHQAERGGAGRHGGSEAAFGGSPGPDSRDYRATSGHPDRPGAADRRCTPRPGDPHRPARSQEDDDEQGPGEDRRDATSAHGSG